VWPGGCIYISTVEHFALRQKTKKNKFLLNVVFGKTASWSVFIALVTMGNTGFG